MNRSRVFPARLLGTGPKGGRAEILLLKELPGGAWEALLRPSRRLKVGDQIRVLPGLSIEVASGPKGPDGRRVVRGALFEETLERAGHVPLPPYIRRPDRPEDRERYQTVYARERGSVAAPTAGLHFTEGLFKRLEVAGVGRTDILLHVGPGTFQPVRVEDVEAHRVAAEAYWIPSEAEAAICATRARGGRVIAVGTTTTRALESAATVDGRVLAGSGETDLVITPGYSFRVIDGLLTNFHLPRSSLLLLVSALAGREKVLAAYAEAVAKGYRFYSYGDAMLIL